MREIKFRAWSWKDRQMYEDVGVYEGQTYIQAEKTYDTPNSEFIRLKGDVALMQFTGLHDKNGKGIYDGDIVQDQEQNVMAVTWKNAGWFLTEWEGEGLSEDDFMECEIIGNIYENPELLTKE